MILAGGRGSRLGGVDKASVELGGRTLLDRILAAADEAVEVVVVGTRGPTAREVTVVREDPAYGGPVAGLFTGRDALRLDVAWLVVLAVDMPHVTPATVRRLVGAAAQGARVDGAVLVDPHGRRQAALALELRRLDAVRPGVEEQHDFALHRLLAPLDLVEVASHGHEHRDVDTWADLTPAPPD